MNSLTDSEFRLNLTRDTREAAGRAFDREDWAVCVRQAQLAVENAAKAVLATQGPIPHTHEPQSALRALIDRKPDLPKSIHDGLSNLISYCDVLGSREHILASHGNESAQLTPSQLFDQPRARRALDTACAATDRAEQCIGFLTGAHDDEERADAQPRDTDARSADDPSDR